jgi:histidinol-phosphate phosphatase family protein
VTPLRRAAFLDRDGTLIRDANFLADPDDVELLPGIADVVRRLNEAGIPVVVVTNQSGIDRGLLTEAQYEATRERLDSLLGAAGARIDATYHCPHFPEVSGPCDCRKPGTGLYRRAAAALGIDLAASLYVGDRYRDVAPGVELGGRAVLVPSPSTPDEDLARAVGRRSPTLAFAVETFLAPDCAP